MQKIPINPMISDFDEYIRQVEPDKKEKGVIWQAAIGLQQVDGLKPSVYLWQIHMKMIELIEVNNTITIIEMAKKLSISETAIENNMKKLREKGIISRVGSDKTGSWKILK